MSKSCENCRFTAVVGKLRFNTGLFSGGAAKEFDDIRCVYNPPSVVGISNRNELATSSHYPRIPSIPCSKWEPKPKENKK